MSYHLSDNSKLHMVGVDPRLIEIAELAIKLTVVDFGIPSTGGRRSAEQQYALYRDGKSKCDGYSQTSKHQDGLALDFYAYVDGRATWEKEHLVMVAAAFLQAASILRYQVEWGGLWTNFVDMPHIQLYDEG